MLADNYDYADMLLNLSEKDFPTNREWLESLSDEDLAAFYTDDLIVHDCGVEYPVGIIQIIRGFRLSAQKIKEWLSQPCVYLMEEEK